MLQLSNLTRRFGDRVAVDDVSFHVPDGKIVGFVGGNGAGKTTTMRLIMGVLAADAGSITWDGHLVTAHDRRRFGYMPEERGLYPKQPIRDQLIYLGELQGLPLRQATASANELLERFGLADRGREALESLSLGNQQRVQVAAALIAAPRLLILDEPFSGLDPAAIDNMIGLLRDHTDQGTSVLFSSHQLDLVEELSDRIVILDKGKVRCEGTPQELRGEQTSVYRFSSDQAATWVHDLDWVSVLAEEPGSVLLQLPHASSRDRFLREALERGSINELTPITPSIADIFREVVAA